jgi:hypothetical protein
MPWLGDGTWVQDARLARAIIHGRTNYRPWSGDISNLTVREEHECVWGPVEEARITGNPHRKCQVAGCNKVTLDLEDE